eukprot:scaffold358181_cov29-Prasinocladus_malaysianus.AAC.1
MQLNISFTKESKSDKQDNAGPRRRQVFVWQQFACWQILQPSLLITGLAVSDSVCSAACAAAQPTQTTATGNNAQADSPSSIRNPDAGSNATGASSEDTQETLSRVGEVMRLKDGLIDVAWANGNVSSVTPDEIFV